MSHFLHGKISVFVGFLLLLFVCLVLLCMGNVTISTVSSKIFCYYYVGQYHISAVKFLFYNHVLIVFSVIFIRESFPEISLY